MRIDPNNPESNQLPSGMDESELGAAIDISGYPLQGLVAKMLRDQFSVTEEWGYIDRETKEHRSLDLFAGRRLSPTESNQTAVHPHLALLIECKRSRHPYVFFRSVASRHIPSFPRVVGMPGGGINIMETGTNRGTLVSASSAFGIQKLPFVSPGPPKCATFAKAAPSGKKVELTGADPFNSLILPLSKALDHAVQAHGAETGPASAAPTLMLLVSVLDAPMLLVDEPEQATAPVLCPWVRIFREEATGIKGPWERSRYYTIDAVHSGFLESFLAQHLLPFAHEFAERCTRFSDIVLRGGELASLDNWKWDDVKPATPQVRGR